MSRPGLFLVLEGMDGAGKTTQAARLAARIETSGRRVLHVREPGGTVAGERIRAVLLDPAVGDLDAATEVFLYQAARRRLVIERIRPALSQGEVVVCERWHYATSAYQGAGGGADPAFVEATSRVATVGLEPRRAVLLAVSPDAAERRIRRPRDRIEQRGGDYRERVSAALRRIFSGDADRFRVVDADRDEAAVEADVWEAVRDLL
jgi:dTMP kinase